MPYWMWIGNRPTQYNSTPTTNLSATQVSRINGYEASGSSEISPVMMNGATRQGNFWMTYSSGGGTAMNYVSPAVGAVSDTRITTAVTAQIQLFDLNDNGDEVSIGTFPGVLLQMRNGDVFFRPNAQSVGQWSGIDRFYSMSVNNAAALPAGGGLSSTVGFNPDITQIEIPCFTRGTMIRTADGDVAIENLRIGDLVVTKDHGPQPIRWIGSRRLGSAALRVAPNLRPIRIRAGALGAELPQQDLIVSPQHRVLVRSKIAQKMFGTYEVLVAAKQLLQVEGIDIVDDLVEVEYFHILFDRHEVVFSNGATTEALYTGPQSLKSVGKAAAAEIFALFPEIADPGYVTEPALPLVSGRMARKLAVRHIQHDRCLVSSH